MNGLDGDDWSAFGAFVAAPVGALLFLVASVLFGAIVCFMYAKGTGTDFTVFKKPLQSSVETNSVDLISINDQHEYPDEESLRNNGMVAKKVSY
ncbi:hypothetical protein V1504DRAFT_436949 [Lipomyces starkeyi]